MKNFTRILMASSLMLMTAFTAYSQDVFKTASVGIGTTTPQQKLDVHGNVQFTGALMPGSAAGTAGNILLSAGAGLAPTWLTNGATGTVLTIGGGGVPTWATPSSTSSGDWHLTGNSGTTYGTNFVGTTDNNGLMFKVDGNVAGRIENASASGASWQNTSFGYQALNPTTGSNYDWYNTAIGYQALTANQYGPFNTAVGDAALASNTGTSGSASSGAQNTAVGASALNANTTGSYNVGLGNNALIHAQTASYNTMVGASVASNATVTGSYNDGIGYQAFQNLTGGQYNDGMGYQEQYNLSTGNNNVALGYQSSYTNSTASGNVAVGYYSLYKNTASQNASIGTYSLYNNTGKQNTGVGDSALYTNTSGTDNTAIGYNANVGSGTLTNATAIGANATATVSNTLILGTTGANAPSVGIGTTTPSSLFHIYSSNFSGTGKVGLTIQDGASGGGNYRLWVSDNGNGEGNDKFIIYDNTANADRVTLNSSGYFGVGTTNPTQELQVQGNFYLSNAFMPGGNAGTAGYVLESQGAGNAPTWVAASSGGSGWALTGNSGTTYGTNFVGTTDNNGLMLKVDGNVAGRIENASASGASWQNTSFGYQALNPTTGSNYDWYNTAMGYQALGDNQYGSWNTAVGNGALGNNTGTSGQAGIIGSQNTALGAQALNANTTGGANVAVGNNALVHAQATSYNEMVGWGAASSATVTGSYNDALGAQAFNNLTGGQYNDAIGYQSQYNLSSGTSNVAIGYHSLYSNTTAASNVAVGYSSLLNTTASKNVAVGDSALYTNTTGTYNTVLGYQANVGLNNLTNATAIGANATVSTSNTVILGAGTVTEVGFNGALAPYYGGIYNPGTSGEVLTSTGSGTAPTWQAPSGGSSTVTTDSSATSAVENTLTGNGSAIYPLKIAQDNATSGQVLQWNGVTWKPANATGVGDNWGTQVVETNATLTGSGVAPGSLLGIAQQGATSGQVLEWNGATWAPATIAAGGSGWALTGNSGTTAGTNFVGTTDANALVFKTDGFEGMRLTNGGGSAGGFVGIGTATPLTALHVYFAGGNSSGDAGITIQNGAATGGSFRIWVPDNSNSEGGDKLIIWDNGASADRFTLNSSGYFGLGTTNPTQELQVQGNFYLSNAFMPGGNAGTTGNVLLSAGAGNAPTWLAGGTTGYVLTSNGTGSAPTWQAASGGGGSGWALTGNSGTTAGTNFVGTTDANDLVFKTNATEYMRIMSTTSSNVHIGSVGIGTSSPISVLDIASSSLSGTGEVGLTIQDGASGGGNYRLWVSDNGNGEGNDKFIIYDNTTNSDRFTLNSSGYFGLGTTNPTQELQVQGNFYLSNAFMPGGNAGTTGYVLESQGAGNAPTWVAASSGGSGWALTGNSGTTYGTNFVGTTDNNGLMFKVDGNVAGRIENASASGASWQNTSFGYQALNNTTGSNYDWYNTAIGYQALTANQYGPFNTAVGDAALASNTGTSGSASSGAQNTAVGASALNANTTGSYNVGLGNNALIHAQTASYNTMVGASVASNATVTGSYNDGIGYQAFQNLTGGQYNDGMGYQEQYNLSTGNKNVALGYQSSYTNSTASSNVAAGYYSLYKNTASQNASIGTYSLYNNTGKQNTAVGDSALYTNTSGTDNTALGYNANVGSSALTNATALGANATVSTSNTVILGASTVTEVGFNGALAPYYGGIYNPGTVGEVLTSTGPGTAPTWQTPSGGGGTGWALTGNSGTTPGTNFVGTTDAKDLVFKTDNNEIMRIANSTQNVGIGTSTPNSASELEIDQNFNGGGTGMLHLHSTGTEAGISLLEDNNSNGSQQYSIKDGDNGAGQTYFAIHDESGGSTPFVITPTSNTPDNSNFVGINQTNPGSVFDVYYPGGNSDGNAGVTIENGSSQSYRLWISDGSNGEDQGNGGFLIWDNNSSTDRFLLTPSGQFGLNLGTSASPQSELDVAGNTTIGGDYAGNNGAPNNGLLVEGATSIGTTSNTNELDVAGNMAIGSYAGSNGAPSNGLIVSGNVGVATNSPNSTFQVGTGAGNSGNVSMPINVLSGSGTINLSTSPNNYTVILTATPSVTLPAAAASNTGRIYILVNGTANAGTISSYIPHGTSTASTTFPASVTVQLQSNGTNWYQIN